MDQVSLSDCLYFVKYWAITIVCDVMNFKIILIFLIKPFFQHDQKVITKT